MSQNRHPDSLFIDPTSMERETCAYVGMIHLPSSPVIPRFIKKSPEFRDCGSEGLFATTKTVKGQTVDVMFETDMMNSQTDSWVRRVFSILIECPFEVFEQTGISIASNCQDLCRRRLAFFPFITGPTPPDPDLIRVGMMIHCSRLHFETLTFLPEEPEELTQTIDDMAQSVAELFVETQDRLLERYADLQADDQKEKKSCVVV